MMREETGARRAFLRTASIVGTGLILSRWVGGERTAAGKEQNSKQEAGEEVSPVEDLMREHGVLRRALLVYTAAAATLRGAPSTVAPAALQKTATLFRTFGEDYHEKKLEETYIFPAVKQAGGPVASLPDILVEQHQRGREITDYILAMTAGAKFGASNAEPLAKVLEAFVLMYRHHAAREDTLVFPAWKRTLSAKQRDEMGEKFEEIEHQQFGEDGYKHAVKQIGDI